MGSASCKNTRSSEKTEKKEDIKQITIGVFGLDNAGKTSAVKAIEGAPTNRVTPTVGSSTSTVPNPITAKGDNKNQERIKIIDVSGAENFREKSWSNFYSQIHGLIFVIDASEKKRMMDNIYTLGDLLKNEDLKDKPILILANKQDRKGAIDDEDNLKHKFKLDQLKAKHKIELCTAIPNDDEADESIRKGFTWLIKTIDTDYTQLNARVKNTRQSKPTDKKPPINNKQKNPKSDPSESDDSNRGNVYPKKRSTSPVNKNQYDRSPNFSNKLPVIDKNKNKPKPSHNGYNTHSEDEEKDSLPYSRPNISHRSDTGNNDRNRPINQPISTATNNFNKKKKVIGGASSNNDDSPIKKPNDNEPKSFRASYERFPEDSPWSSSTNKTTKTDDILSRPYQKPSITNDPTKRNMSPLVHDIKPYGSGSISKPIKGSDDEDDDFKQRPKPTSTLPSLNRFHDSNKYDDHKYTSSLSTSKTPSTIKKSTSGIYGAAAAADDDDDYDKNKNNSNRRPNVTVPTTTTVKKPYIPDNDSDDDNYPKKSTFKTNKSYDSDDDNINKTKPRPSDRLNLNSDYRGTASKPPPIPSTSATPLKLNGDSFSSSLTKTPIRKNFDDDDDDVKSSLKPINRSKYDGDDRPSSSSKLTAGSKYDDRPVSSSKITARPKYGGDDDDDDSPLSPSKVAGRSKYDNNYSASPSKPTLGSKYNDNERTTSTKPLPHSRFDDDDDDRPSFPSKVPARPKYDDDDRSFSPSKPASKSKFDDDDDDRPSYPSKTPARSFSPSKPASKSKFDDDDDDRPSYPSKTPARSFSPSKPASKSKFDDDDDDDRPSYPSKTPARSFSPSKPASKSKFDDDDDDDRPSYPSKTPARSFSPSKPASKSKFDDDDDYPSSPSKKTNDSSRYDEYSGSGGARARHGTDDFDSSKGGSYNTRAVSASARRPRTDMDDDD